jgi:hypothetical protein
MNEYNPNCALHLPLESWVPLTVPTFAWVKTPSAGNNFPNTYFQTEEKRGEASTIVVMSRPFLS